MYRFFFVVFMMGALVLLGPVHTMAQKQSGYCDSAESTADALDCVNRNRIDVQARLKTVFDMLGETLDSKQRKALDESQQSWLAYRDAQCKWERGQAENPSLERIYELSCITLLTTMRTEMLSMSLDRENDDAPREFGSQPRWMNVLSHDYPDVFWRYGKWIKADLDCDGDDEQILTGIAFDPEQSADLSAKLVVAITDNPRTGRPTPTLVKVNIEPEKAEDKKASAEKAGNKTEEKAAVQQAKAPPHLCSTVFDYTFASGQEDAAAVKAGDDNTADLNDKDDNGEDSAAETENNKKAGACKASLQIIDNICKPVTIFWKDGTYSVRQDDPADG